MTWNDPNWTPEERAQHLGCLYGSATIGPCGKTVLAGKRYCLDHIKGREHFGVGESWAVPADHQEGETIVSGGSAEERAAAVAAARPEPIAIEWIDDGQDGEKANVHDSHGQSYWLRVDYYPNRLRQFAARIYTENDGEIPLNDECWTWRSTLDTGKSSCIQQLKQAIPALRARLGPSRPRTPCALCRKNGFVQNMCELSDDERAWNKALGHAHGDNGDKWMRLQYEIARWAGPWPNVPNPGYRDLMPIFDGRAVAILQRISMIDGDPWGCAEWGDASTIQTYGGEQIQLGFVNGKLSRVSLNGRSFLLPDLVPIVLGKTITVIMPNADERQKTPIDETKIREDERNRIVSAIATDASEFFEDDPEARRRIYTILSRIKRGEYL